MSDADRIEAAAACWVARRDAAPLSTEEQGDFDTWCQEDPRHLGAFVRLEAVNARLERAVALKGMAAETAGRGRLWLPAAAAAALVAGLFGLWQVTGNDAPPSQARSLATRTGEQYRASLADGSLLELNTATRLAVALEPKAREIRMDAGEAVFDVAKDPARPFIVRTELGDVRAVGTVFSVRVDRGLEVLVSEGVVVVEKEGRKLAEVAAGENYMLSAKGEAKRAARTAEEIRRSLVWRDGKLAFAGETLDQAAREFNRYNELRIEIGDDKAKAMRLGGYFRATDPQGFAAAIARTLPVETERDDGAIIITSR